MKEGFNEGIYYDDWKDANIRASFLEKWLRVSYDVGYQAGEEDKEAEFDSRSDIE